MSLPLTADEVVVAWNALGQTRTGQASDGQAELAALQPLRVGASPALLGVIDLAEAVLRRHTEAAAASTLSVLTRVVEAGQTCRWEALRIAGEALSALVHAESGAVDNAVVAHARARTALGQVPADPLSGRLYLLAVDALGVTSAMFGLDDDLMHYWAVSEQVERRLRDTVSDLVGTQYSAISRSMHGLEVALAPIALGGPANQKLLRRCDQTLTGLIGAEGLTGGPAELVVNLHLVAQAYLEDPPVGRQRVDEHPCPPDSHSGSQSGSEPSESDIGSLELLEHLIRRAGWSQLRWHTARTLCVAAVLHCLNAEAVPDLVSVGVARAAHRGLLGQGFSGGGYLLAGAERLLLEQRMLALGQPNEVEAVAMRQLRDVSTQLRLTQTALHSAVSAQEVVEALRTSNAQLREASRTDALTQVGNRRHLEETMVELGGQAAEYGVLIIDIDRFKQVNDSVGHLAADRVLRAVAGLIGSCVRQHDMVFRYGGDEFVALLPGISVAACAQRAADVGAAVAGFDWTTIDPALQVTVTVGQAAGEDAVAHLLDRADRALLAGKRARLQPPIVTR